MSVEIRRFGSYDEIDALDDIEVRFESISLRDYEALKDAYDEYVMGTKDEYLKVKEGLLADGMKLTVVEGEDE